MLSGHSSSHRTPEFLFFLLPQNSSLSCRSCLAFFQLQGGISAFICGPGMFLTALTPRIQKKIHIKMCFFCWETRNQPQISRKRVRRKRRVTILTPGCFQSQAGGVWSHLGQWKLFLDVLYPTHTTLGFSEKQKKKAVFRKNQKFSEGFLSWRREIQTAWLSP